MEISGSPTGKGRRFAVVASRFNELVTSRLLDGAVDALKRHGVMDGDIDVTWVPGAWELPLAARQLIATGRYAGLVVVGAVIRGETPHFDYVANEASRGLAQASLDSGCPVGFGVLTCDNVMQAAARAGGAHGNKAWDAAMAALEMADLVGKLTEDA